MHPKRVLVGVLCFLVASAMLSPAFAQTPSRHPVKSAQGPKPLVSLGAPSTIPAYKAVLIADGLCYPSGIGAFPERNRVLFNTQCDYQLWYFYLGTLTAVPVPASVYHASRYNGGFFVGDDYGYIYQLKDGPEPGLETLARITHSLNYILGLDVDPVTRSIYVVSDRLPSYLNVLPQQGRGAPITLANLGFDSWGVAVRGNYLYVSDTYGGRIWRIKKTGGPLTVYASGFNGPTDIIADSKGNLYVAEFFGGSVKMIPAYTTKTKTIAWGMSMPYYLGLDSRGDIYVSDFDAGIVWMLKKK